MDLSKIPFLIQSLLGNAVVLGVIAWLGKGWADRRLEAVKGGHAAQLEGVKGEQSKALEAVKAELANLGREVQAGVEKKMMIFKTHFELEFKNYREIWSYCDISLNIACQTSAYYELQALDEQSAAAEKKASVERYDTARIALDTVRKHRPFIAKDIADKSIALLTKALSLIQTYKDVYPKMSGADGANFDRGDFIREAREECRAMRTMSDELATMIAARISRMYVADFGETESG